MFSEKIENAYQLLETNNAAQAIETLAPLSLQEIPDHAITGKIALLRAQAYFQLGEYKSAVENAHKAMKYLENGDSTQSLNICLEVIGRSHFHNNYYQKAIPFLEKASAYWRNVQDFDNYCRCQTTATYALLNTGGISLAEQYLTTILSLLDQIKNPEVKREALILAAAVHTRLAMQRHPGNIQTYLFFGSLSKIAPSSAPAFQDQILKALEFLEQAYTLEPFDAYSLTSAVSMSQASALCSLIGRGDHALLLLETALPILKKLGSSMEICLALQNQAYALLQRPKPAAAILSLEEAWNIATQQQCYQILPSLLFDLTNAHAHQGNTNKALNLTQALVDAIIEKIIHEKTPQDEISHPNGKPSWLEQASQSVQPVNQPEIPTYIHTAKTYLLQNLMSRPTIAEVAAQASVTPRTVQLGFLKYLGQPPMKWAQNMRLQGIHDELEATPIHIPIRIGEVAKRWGYAQVSTFCQEYKRKFGFSPSNTRRK